MEIFDEAGNLKTKKPESDKIIPEKEVFCCQYCTKEWDKKISKSQHEAWCSENPNRRTYRKTKAVKKPKAEVVEKPKAEAVKEPKEESQIKSKTKIFDGIDMIKELSDFDKLFVLTDEQIAKYVRDKIRKYDHNNPRQRKLN